MGIEEKIIALLFDNTTINSGSHKELATLFKEKLSKKVSYLTCHHYILELFVETVCNVVFSKIKSQKNLLFKELTNMWPDCLSNRQKNLVFALRNTLA